MAAGPFLSQRLAQSQTLALTPAMQLKLKLWQMNLQELSQTIERELEDNPLLELSDDSDEIPTLEAIEEGRDSDVTEGSAEQMADGEKGGSVNDHLARARVVPDHRCVPPRFGGRTG